MAGLSYAALARKAPTTVVSNGNGNGNDNGSNGAGNGRTWNGVSPTSPASSEAVKQQVKELAQPSPASMTLTATLQLLTPLTTQTDVFLMTREYLQNWLTWAYHQTVQKVEASRAEAAVRLAATHLGLVPPELDMEYHEPGPIDNTGLSQADGCPLILRPNVRLIDGSNATTLLHWNELTKKIESLAINEQEFPALGGKEDDKKTQEDSEVAIHEEDERYECCAVPIRFYETLRASHGVFCDDGFSVSFQPFPRDADEILLHQIGSDEFDDGDDMGQTHGVYVDISDDMIQNQYPQHYFANGGVEESHPSQPIEFRRKVIVQPAPIKPKKFDVGNSTMSKLLQQEHQRKEARMMASVEVYPIKLSYAICSATSDENDTGSAPNPIKGFVLVSQRTLVSAALHSLMKVAAPETSSSCKRIWSKRGGISTSGDGFELVDIENLDGKLRRKDKADLPLSKIRIGEWVRSHTTELSEDFELEVIIEVKRPNQQWPRSELELENRIAVGDIVDAQDAAGKWYEALVREVADETVTVHYFGWASRWDSTIRRRAKGDVPDNISARINQPAPLWSHSSRWREKLEEGKIVEIRDASSKVDRPRWYKGVIKAVNRGDKKLHKIEGGAKLEKFGKPGATEDEKEPLLLLGRTDQLLIEVQEERDVVGDPASNEFVSEFFDEPLPDPPFLRWVNAYSEEICEAGTHTKMNREKDPAVVTLRYEFEHGRKPVEILKSHNGMFGSGYMKEHLRGTPPAPGSTGLHNLGNSCFLNSIVQCLIHARPLTKYFLNSEYKNDLNRQNPLGSGGHVASAYSALLREMWSGQYSALAPRLLKQTVASFAPQFNNSYQHDSQEFCQFLMDGLHEDCNRVKSKPYVEELEGFGMDDQKAAIETWRKHLLRHDSAVVDHCQGMHRSHLTCPVCGRESIKFDVFSTISLPVSNDKSSATVDLSDCVDKFMEGEQLDDLNAWYCPNCKKHVCALKMIALWSVPDIFILHLKRFTFDHDSKTNQVVRSKIDDSVKFPIDNLDLTKHVLGPIDEDAPPIYNLFGVSEHSGATANSGHYTATVRNSKDGRWYRFNDAHVGETTGDAAVTGGAYVLFYQRAKGSARWSGMEKEMKKRNIDPHGGMDTDQDGFTKVRTKK